MIGQTIGPYQVLAKLGEGGMGEVYRATDSKLKRQVAIKILPPSVAADAERLARFQREAEVLASLNHSNIGAIYGLEESAGITALVMELVEGDDLSQRISRGAVPLDEALAIAKQIADALEAAHEQGIVHRDLKPANIKLRSDGTVKVLDFGLAKATDPATAMSGATITSPVMSMPGVILGTAAYMSPEQAKGRAVDRRADIWAFGAVLYEMLTAKRAFPGDDITEAFVSVISRDPDWAALPSSTPLRVRSLLRRCLDKDAKRRLRDIGEARVALEGVDDQQPAAAAAPSAHARNPLVLVSALVAVASLGVAAWAVWNRPAAVQTTSTRLTIPLPPGAEITSYPAISRDGRTVAFVAQHGTDEPQLYLRDLNSFESRAVAGSSGAKQPFFSPDGRWVSFFAKGQLQKAEVAGGAPIRVVEATYGMGGTWNDDNTIVYAESLSAGLSRVPAGGGAPEPLTKPDGAAKGYAHVFPQALPGGRSILFTIWGQTQGNAVLSLDSGQWQMVLPSKSFASAVFDAAGRGGGATSGRLLIIDESAGLRAAPFDPAHPAPASADASVLSDVYSDWETETRGWLATSNTGTAVYAPGNPAKASLVWIDRAGRIESLGKEQDIYREVSISPDGTKAVVRRRLDLWIQDLQRGTRTPLTSASASNFRALWSRDGQRIVFASNRGGSWRIYSQPADGSRPAEALLTSEHDQFPYSILQDGTILYGEINPRTGRDLWTMSADGKASPWRATPFNEVPGQFSPGPDDARRKVAYASDESGRYEIYAQSYRGDANRIQISSEGGIWPIWSRDGKELFYVTVDAVMAVAIRPDGSFGAPQKLFALSNSFLSSYGLSSYRFATYDVSPDGKRFLMIQRDPGSMPRQLNVILNWK